MWFCLGIRRGVGRASTSRCAKSVERVDLGPRYQWCHRVGREWDDGSVGCRRGGAPFGDAAVVSRDSRRGAVRALSASSHCREGFIGPLDGLSLLIDTGTIPSVVDVRIARKLRLKASHPSLVAFGQQRADRERGLDGFRIGALRVGPGPAGVGDLSYLKGLASTRCRA